MAWYWFFDDGFGIISKKMCVGCNKWLSNSSYLVERAKILRLGYEHGL